MTYLQLINRFWDVDRASPFTPCETRLYMLLLDVANRNRWEGELALTKEELATRLGVSPATLLRARERLSEAGMISYTQGGGRRKLTEYSIADCPLKGAHAIPFQDKKGIEKGVKNDTVYDTLSDQKGIIKGTTIAPFTPIDIDSSYKTEDIIVEKKENYKKEKAADIPPFAAPRREPIGEVVRQLANEGAWGESVCMKFRLSPDSLTDLLDEYRLHCMTIGEERKTVKDAKRHFTNWLRAKQRGEREDYRYGTDRNDNRTVGRDERDTTFQTYIAKKLTNGSGG